MNTAEPAIVDASMDVYLVPVGDDRYELYCEVPDDPSDGAEEAPPGYLRGLVHRFKRTIADAERERRHGSPAGESAGWTARMRARSMRWVAESIAEQRLLWHLRSQATANLFFPDDIDAGHAEAILRRHLGRDFEKHRFWLAIDSVGFILSGLLMLIPGPNLLAYYFAFRLVGHYLSLRGAKRGLNGVTWHPQPSAPLSELRRLLTMEPAARESRVAAVAETLRLEHFVKFFERTTVSA
jgi:hypothetical protein